MLKNIFKSYQQFINSINKIPVDSNAVPTNPLDRNNHKTFEEAVRISENIGGEVGFVFTKDDPFFFVDIDHALLSSGEWSPLAKTICRAFPGCAVEISRSGKGLHIYGTGSVQKHNSKNIKEKIELYTQDRFTVMTGLGASGDPDTCGQLGLNWLVPNYFTPRSSENRGDSDWTVSANKDWRGPEDDLELLKMAYRVNSASKIFGGKASFIDLYECNTESLARSYPSGTDDFDRSSADAALAMHLAFFTGKNCERMERIFGDSALGQRSKWQDREAYRESTILFAVNNCTKVYSSQPKKGDGGLKVGSQTLDVTQQIEYFEDCIYLVSKHKVLTKKYGLLRPEQFKTTYGGHDFVVKPEGKPLKNAFEVLTESQLYKFPKVYSTCFRPALSWGEIIVKGGDEYINTYVDIPIPRKSGNVDLFLNHIKKLLPIPREQEILLNYLASFVQNKGVKFSWAPLLQGVEGNGKTFFARVLEQAIGERYTHPLNTASLTGGGLKFTGWAKDKILIVLEDLKIMSKQEDIIESLKSLITGDRIELQGKGIDQVSEDSCMNFFIISNHKDAVPKTSNGRRYCTLFTAQQSKKDLTRDEMGPQYFRKLYDWAKKDGYSFITDYLHNYKLNAEFDPAQDATTAPETSSTEEAVVLSLGRPAQEILESIAQEDLGFKGGWISSVALERLFTEKKCFVPLNKRKNLLEEIGYHQKERMSSISVIDGGKKPMLYATSSKMGIKKGRDTKEDYLKCQNNSNAESEKAAVIFGETCL